MNAFRIVTMLFPEGKRKALTLSYDDGTVYDRRLVELMNRYGIKGTFNLNSGTLGRGETKDASGKVTEESAVTLEELPKLYAGHEIATHASKHTAPTGCGSVALYEILEDRKVFESILPYLVTGHAYPFGRYDKEVFAMLKAAGIRYARTVRSTESFGLPEDFLEWHPTAHHNNPRLMELAKRFCEWENEDEAELFYLWGHSYEFAREDNWQVIEDFLSYMAGFADTVWMATNGEIVDYVTAYKNLVFSADGSKVYNPSAQTVWLTARGKVFRIAPGQVNAEGVL
ncbi:MAG: polysaccharide deacetylase family protein [Roseburia sp.]|nr:polysaccharide deacetylase family protein [Roseburia sp.]MCM1242443.1 polysaccharide deacetylase family protein [Roseburia sp.]